MGSCAPRSLSRVFGGQFRGREADHHVKLVALLVLLSQTQVSGSSVSLPKAVINSLRESGYHVPSATRSQHVVRADVDANGYEDWAILVNPGTGQAAILLAYQFEDHWRGGNIDIWQGSPGPVKIELLPPGKYTRQATCGRPLEPNEREQIESAVPGMLVTFADARRRAYQLGPHAWQYVCLGKPS